MSIQPPVNIGETWPEQGGIFAGTLRNPETGEIHHIIMHPNATRKCPWGIYSKKVDGAGSYWDGASNTAAMRTSKCCIDIIGALAELPAINGHNDYHIPAQAELTLICCNLRDKVAPDWHWSSTQGSAYEAWLQGFEYGGQDTYDKNHQLAVRAVRRLKN